MFYHGKEAMRWSLSVLVTLYPQLVSMKWWILAFALHYSPYIMQEPCLVNSATHNSGQVSVKLINIISLQAWAESYLPNRIKLINETNHHNRVANLIDFKALYLKSTSKMFKNKVMNLVEQHFCKKKFLQRSTEREILPRASLTSISNKSHRRFFEPRIVSSNELGMH